MSGASSRHPVNNHVNAGQSTSDAMATATNVALYREIMRLHGAVRHQAEVLEEKIAEHRDTVKLSRTCLQDAVPITFGQAFGAYLAVITRGVGRLAAAAEACLDVPMGGTVVGTGLGVGAGYVERIYPRLRETTGLELCRHPNSFDAFQNGDVFQYVSTIFKALACGLIKIAKDLRILASGNRAGLMEITLPAVQAGSSFMPGKVNPVMAELVVQVGLQACGNDTVVTMAVEGAELDFNAWTAVIVKNLFESARLLTNTLPLFAGGAPRGRPRDVDQGGGDRVGHRAPGDRRAAARSRRAHRRRAQLHPARRAGRRATHPNPGAGRRYVDRCAHRDLRRDLTPAECELVYACAAWLAGADSVTATAETDLLATLRDTLHLESPAADSIQSNVDTMRAERRRYLPRSEQLPWCEEFGELLHRLASE